MKTITLSDELYKQLINELYSLFSYHWNDHTIHADDCGSKVLPYIQNQQPDKEKEICSREPEYR